MTHADDSRAAIEARARAWLVRMRSGHATVEDAQAFRRWCEESPEHANEVRLLSETWTTLDQVMAEIRVENAQADRLPAARGMSRRRRVGRRAFIGFAAVAGASWLVVRPPLQLWPALGDLAADYRTGTGEQRQVALSDRIVVDMNTQTRINLLRARAEQPLQHGIELLAGEAEIVAASPAAGRIAPIRPVVVVAGPGRLQADIARFNVRLTDHAVCVTCMAGAVAIEHPRQRLTLAANQQLVYDARDVGRPVQVDTNGVTAWRRGMLVFNGVPLQEVIDEINRYRPGRVILRKAEIQNLNVQAQFALAHLDEAIAMICRYAGVHATRLPGSIVLLS